MRFSPTLFLSTLSLRRATRQVKQTCRVEISISIHALLAESDGSHYRSSGSFKRFLSTLSLRRATAAIRLAVLAYYISIHALLAESDFPIVPAELTTLVFLSTLSLRRATRGGDPCYLDKLISIHALLAESDASTTITTICIALFLSTLSLRRATLVAPLLATGGPRYFYPRSPCGERLAVSAALQLIPLISIHALLAESDLGSRIYDMSAA